MNCWDSWLGPFTIHANEVLGLKLSTGFKVELTTYLCWPHQFEWSPQALRKCLVSQIISKVLYIYMTRHYYFGFRGGGPIIPRHSVLLQLRHSLLFIFFNLMVSLYQRSCDSLAYLAAEVILTWCLALASDLVREAVLFLLRSPIFEFLYLSVS